MITAIAWSCCTAQTVCTAGDQHQEQLTETARAKPMMKLIKLTERFVGSTTIRHHIVRKKKSSAPAEAR